MAADSKLNALIERRDKIDATIADIECVGIARAAFDGLQEVTNIELERLQNQRVDLNRRIVQRMAWLNGRSPFLVGTMTRCFELPDKKERAAASSDTTETPETPLTPSNPVDPVTPTTYQNYLAVSDGTPYDADTPVATIRGLFDEQGFLAGSIVHRPAGDHSQPGNELQHLCLCA